MYGITESKNGYLLASQDVVREILGCNPGGRPASPANNVSVTLLDQEYETL
jgi:hypothetical protein